MAKVQRAWEHTTNISPEQHGARSYDVIVLNTDFDPSEVCSVDHDSQSEGRRLKETQESLEICTRSLKDGGLLFVYGLPRNLPDYAVFLESLRDDESSMLFKYWIAIEFRPLKTSRPIPNSHVGMLMYLKTRSRRSPTPFTFNTKDVRIPHRFCTACGENVRDWGGKKHLMNGEGCAVSDVWDLTATGFADSSRIPLECLERIRLLVDRPNLKMLVVTRKRLEVRSVPDPEFPDFAKKALILDSQVLHADSFEYMRDLADNHPEGVFDLVFADPPYNLAKNYSTYDDTLEDQNYISWCNEWLSLMARVMRPGGSLFVLNIPKWAIHHAKHLNTILDFQHWIVWDSLSSPAGKLMPAHYALLYYTKRGAKTTANYDSLAWIDSREHCLRGSCVASRKRNGDDSKEALSEVWHDVHRIKHKKDRDMHPCQLPTKLMRRIVQLATDDGDWVYDPFGGAGTTAVAARLENRNFVITELDPEYVKIAKSNLSKINVGIDGYLYIRRKTVSRKRNDFSKKGVETAFIGLCKKHGRVIGLKELETMDRGLHALIVSKYRDYKTLAKIARRRLEMEDKSPPEADGTESSRRAS